MTKLAAWAFLGLLLLPLAAPLASAAPTTFTINVVSARSLGCSPDSWTEADLRVRVLVNNVPVLTTGEASDQREPTFGALVTTSAQLPATIAVEVDEGEPSGFFGTTYVACSVAPGGATRAELVYNGGAAVAFRALGDGSKGAEAILVVGTGAPAAPSPTVTTLSASSLRLDWANDASGQATGHRVASGGAGAVREATVSGNSATITGLCDNQEYTLRVIRDTATWRVSSADVEGKTANVAPYAPTVLKAERAGNVSLESRTLHDAARYEIHAAASASFAPSSSTLRRTITPFSNAFARSDATGVAFQASDAFVVVRLVDTGGLFADSAAFAIGAPARQETFGLSDDCSIPGATTTSSPQPEPEPAPAQPVVTPPTTPSHEEPVCCFGLDLFVEGASFPRVAAGATLNVTFRSTSGLSQTVDVRLADPSVASVEEQLPLVATVQLAPNETRTVALVLYAPQGMERGERSVELHARVREDPNAIYNARMALVLVVPLQSWELESEDLFSVFEVKGSGAWLNVTPGSVVRVDVLLINKADHELRVTTWDAPALRNDADIGRIVIAHGFQATISTLGLTLAPYSKSEQTITIRVPLNATVGEIVGAQVGIEVNNSVKATAVPTFLNVQIVAGPPNVALSADVGAGGGGLSAAALVGLSLAGGGAALALVAWVFASDARRFAIAAALYTRLAKSEVLDHPGREALQQRIGAEPGISYSELRRQSGMNTGAIVHHLRALERAGLVASRKEGAYRRFYPVGAAPAPALAPPPAPAPAHVRVAVLTPMQQRVMDVLREAPLTQGELAERLGLSQQGTSHHVKSLERAGHIEAEYDGRVWRYKPIATLDPVRP